MIADLGNKMQICTQRYGKRPYGVGLLVAGYDDLGPHIFQTCPSANYYGNFLSLVIRESLNKVASRVVRVFTFNNDFLGHLTNVINMR